MADALIPTYKSASKSLSINTLTLVHSIQHTPLYKINRAFNNGLCHKTVLEKYGNLYNQKVKEERGSQRWGKNSLRSEEETLRGTVHNREPRLRHTG